MVARSEGPSVLRASLLFGPVAGFLLLSHTCTGVAPSASVDLAGLDGGRVVLRCQSAGWFPAPEVVWLRGGGDLLPSGPPESLRGPDGLFAVSSRVTVEKTLNNSFTCRVQQPSTNQSTEAHIQVPDDFFISASNCSVSISFSLIFGLLLVFLVGGFIWKRLIKKKEAPNLEELQRELTQQRVQDVLQREEDSLKTQLRAVGQNIQSNREQLQEVEEQISERETELNKPAELLRQKEELLRAQWGLDAEKNHLEKQLLLLEKLQEAAELQ